MNLTLFILCILVSGISSDRTPGKISEQKCAQYSKMTFVDPSGEETIVFPETGGLEYPHMAVIVFDEEGKTNCLCGATLISEQYILTAGHCVAKINKNEGQGNYYVKLGVENLKTVDEHTQIFNISKAIISHYYVKVYNLNQKMSHHNDIGLIKLDREAKINSYVRPACLYLKSEIKETRATVIGYGAPEFTADGSENLRKVILDPSVKEEDCKKNYPRIISKRIIYKEIAFENMFCAAPVQSGDLNINICTGDSGSPLQIFDEDRKVFEVMGVALYGKACTTVPSIFERVSYHVKWIEDIVWPEV